MGLNTGIIATVHTDNHTFLTNTGYLTTDDPPQMSEKFYTTLRTFIAKELPKVSLFPIVSLSVEENSYKMGTLCVTIDFRKPQLYADDGIGGFWAYEYEDLDVALATFVIRILAPSTIEFYFYP